LKEAIKQQIIDKQIMINMGIDYETLLEMKERYEEGMLILILKSKRMNLSMLEPFPNILINSVQITIIYKFPKI